MKEIKLQIKYKVSLCCIARKKTILLNWTVILNYYMRPMKISSKFQSSSYITYKIYE